MILSVKVKGEEWGRAMGEGKVRVEVKRCGLGPCIEHADKKFGERKWEWADATTVNILVSVHKEVKGVLTSTMT